MLVATGGAALLVGTGCDVPGPDRSADSLPDPGRSLLDEVGAGAAAAAARLTATTAAHPGLAPALEGLRTTQAEHLRVLAATLGEDPPAPLATPGPAVPRRSQAALRVLLRAERTRLASVLDGAREVDDGRVARLLACLGAGLAQQLALAEGSP